MAEVIFRSAVRSFLHAHYPDVLRNVPRRLHWNEVVDWYLTLSRKRADLRVVTLQLPER